MKKSILFFTVIFFTITAYPQNDSVKRIRIYTSPLSAIGYYTNSMLTIGLEGLPVPKWGISAEYGIKIHDFNGYDTSLIKSKGYTYRFEIKRYDIIQGHFLKKHKVRDYISIEYRYIKDQYNRRFEYLDDALNEWHIDNYSVLKDIYIGNLKFGLVLPFLKRFYMDVYVGFGFRQKKFRNKNIEYNPALDDLPFYDSLVPVPPPYDFEENSGNPNLSGGFKLGIKL